MTRPGNDAIRAAAGASRRRRGFEPVLQRQVDARWPALTAVTERLQHIRAETDRDALLRGSFVRAAHAPKLGLQRRRQSAHRNGSREVILAPHGVLLHNATLDSFWRQTIQFSKEHSPHTAHITPAQWLPVPASCAKFSPSSAKFKYLFARMAKGGCQISSSKPMVHITQSVCSGCVVFEVDDFEIYTDVASIVKIMQEAGLVPRRPAWVLFFVWRNSS